MENIESGIIDKKEDNRERKVDGINGRTNQKGKGFS